MCNLFGKYTFVVHWITLMFRFCMQLNSFVLKYGHVWMHIYSSIEKIDRKRTWSTIFIYAKIFVFRVRLKVGILYLYNSLFIYYGIKQKYRNSYTRLLCLFGNWIHCVHVIMIFYIALFLSEASSLLFRHMLCVCKWKSKIICYIQLKWYTFRWILWSS